MQVLVADLEANNLYPAVSQLHCLAIVDVETEESKLYIEREGTLKEGLLRLYYADRVVMHNGESYDVPAIQKFYPKFKCNMWDSLVASRMVYPERASHSIEAWGKPWGLEKVQNEDWSVYTELMGTRCLSDITIGLRVYRTLLRKMEGTDWDAAMELEMQVARLHVDQVIAGVDVDVPHCHETVKRLDEELGDIDSKLLSQIPKRCKQSGVTISLPFKKDRSYKKMVIDWFEEERL